MDDNALLRQHVESNSDEAFAMLVTRRNQLGLELVPTNMPIEMLVVEKAQ
jgi:hypothetical protein